MTKQEKEKMGLNITPVKPRGGLTFLQVDIFVEQREKLTELKGITGLTVAALVREAIDLLIKKYGV